MEENLKRIIDLEGNEIDVVDSVTINGLVYDKNSRYLYFDQIIEEYFVKKETVEGLSRILYPIVNKHFLFKGINETISDIQRINWVYSSAKFVMHRNDKTIRKLFFANKEDRDKFIKNNNMFKGKVHKEVYFNESSIIHDFKDPNYFKISKKRLTPEKVLSDSDNRNISLLKNTIEYQELEAALNLVNESYGIDSRSYIGFEGLKHTFGVELETVSGCVDNYDKLFSMNFDSVFDGSLRPRLEDGSIDRNLNPSGAEYVTGVLKGDSGLKQIKKLSELLIDKGCTVDFRTAFHVHIGSLKWNSEDIVYMYLLGIMIQDEVFELMPLDRRVNVYSKKLVSIKNPLINKLKIGKTKKDYTESVKSIYKDIFRITCGVDSPNNSFNKKTRHPKGTHGGYDRDVDHRYSWLNFTNIIFNQRGSLDNKTIEFRAHNGTLSYRKIHLWIKLCMGIVEFSEKNRSIILDAVKKNKKITLDDIIDQVFPKTGSYLKKYVLERKINFSDSSKECQEKDYILEKFNLNKTKELACV